MRKFPLVALTLLSTAAIIFASDARREQVVTKAARTRIADPDSVHRSDNMVKRVRSSNTSQQAPGVFLITSTFDIESNGSMANQLINYGDGTLAFARMTATDQFTNDRGSYFGFFDGTGWVSPPWKVEFERRGWSSFAVMSDGRGVVASHIANEVNVDALKGFGIWTYSLTGFITGAVDHIWPRVAVDGADNIHLVSTLRAQLPGARYGTYYPVHTWSTDQGLTWNHQYIFGDPFTELDTTDGQWQGFAVDSYAIATWGPTRVGIVALAGGAIASDNIWLAISEDNGTTWNTTRITDFANLPAPNSDEIRPTVAMDLIFDHSGNAHVFSTNFSVRLDSLSGVIYAHSVAAPMRHWDETTGWADMLTYEDIPGYDPSEDIFSGGAVDNVGQNNTLLQMPQAGIDADGNLFVVFNTVTPHDTAFDGTNFMDVFATGSSDGGATWAKPVNVSNNPGIEDMWASLADLVDDSLHIIYSSDPDIGHGISGLPFFMDHYYYAFPKSAIDFSKPQVVSLAIADTLKGAPGDTIDVPVFLSRDGQGIGSLGAVLKATNKLLSFVRYTEGPIIPGPVFSVAAPTPDSVRIAFANFGSGPIVTDGVLVNLKYLVNANAADGDIALLNFSDLNASSQTGTPLAISGKNGKVTVIANVAPPDTVTLAVSDSLTGAPGAIVDVPILLHRSGIDVAALGADLKTTNDILAFVDYAEGPIIPGPVFEVSPLQPDSVRMGFVDFGAGPITQDGALAILRFQIATSASAGQVANLEFAGLSVADVGGKSVPTKGVSGKLTVITRQGISISWCETPLTGAVGSRDTVYVCADDLTGQDIISYRVEISYDASKLAGIAATSVNTITQPFGSPVVNIDNGSMTVVGFGIAPLAGSGKLLGLVFDVLSASTDTTSLCIEDIRFNAGESPATIPNPCSPFLIFGEYEITGLTAYKLNGSAVPKVTLNLAADSTQSQVTDSEGKYLFEKTRGGIDYVMTPSKAGDIGAGSITSMDASLAAQHDAGLIQLTPTQQQAADVDEDGAVIAYDAALIARFAVGLPPFNESDHTGEWRFEPAKRNYVSLSSDQPDQDFAALLLGDPDGSWVPQVAVATTLPRGQTEIYQHLVDVEADSGEMISVRMILEPGEEVFAVDIDFHYEPQALQFMHATKTSLSEHFQLLTNSEAGRMRVACYGTAPLTEGGEFLLLQFMVIGAPGERSMLSLQSMQLNGKGILKAEAELRIKRAAAILPAQFALRPNYPNPFNPETLIGYEVPQLATEAVHVSLRVYNSSGQLVRELVSESKSPGFYTARWDGSNQNSQRVPTGLYIYKMIAGDFQATRKMLLVK